MDSFASTSGPRFVAVRVREIERLQRRNGAAAAGREEARLTRLTEGVNAFAL
jgi:hypothetical protein